jgi:ArsR family transcriptional regulator
LKELGMVTVQDPQIFERMAALADAVRSRLLLVLQVHELTVSDLCAVLQLPQSTVSRHLKTLADGGWVASRPDGTRRRYRATLDAIEPSARSLWDLTRAEIESSRTSRSDRERLQSVLARRRNRSRSFFARSGARWDALRDELFGTHFHAFALLGLLDPRWVVGDLGCGSGPVAEAAAPFVRKVVGVDGSGTMLELAAERLRRFDNVELREGDLESLPLRANSLDVATQILVLHHLQHPERAVAEAGRCLRRGGRLLIVDMLPHDRVQYQKEMGHVWLGFAEETIREALDAAGFEAVRFRVLPPAPEAQGPSLFAASAVRGNAKRNGRPTGSRRRPA